MSHDDLSENLRNNLLNISKNLQKASLLAVSKKQPLEKIRVLYDLGQRDFGENYFQELKIKSESQELQKFCPDIKWHFIGQLQSNKINQLINIDNLVCVHSLSSFSHADKISKNLNKKLNILLQINLDEDNLEPNSKRGGFKREGIFKYFERLWALKHIDIKGLSVVLPQAQKYKKNPRLGFEELFNLRNQLEIDFANLDVKLPELSMGMSQDYKEAVDSGSTWVRIGTDLFGVRE